MPPEEEDEDAVKLAEPVFYDSIEMYEEEQKEENETPQRYVRSM